MSSNEKMLLNVLPSILAADNYNNSRRECASVEWNEREEKFFRGRKKRTGENFFFLFFDEKDFVCKENFLISLSFEKKKKKKEENGFMGRGLILWWWFGSSLVAEVREEEISMHGKDLQTFHRR